MHRFKEIMQEVYGEYISGEIWNPKLYTENKGRYLWTDSFGVCNFLTLFCETKEERYLLQADSLINSVHNVLGKVSTVFRSSFFQNRNFLLIYRSNI